MMHKSTAVHPGSIIRADIMEAEGYTLEELCDVLACSQGYMRRLLEERTYITPEIACSLAKQGYGTADMWVKLQHKWNRGL